MESGTAHGMTYTSLHRAVRLIVDGAECRSVYAKADDFLLPVPSGVQDLHAASA